MFFSPTKSVIVRKTNKMFLNLWMYFQKCVLSCYSKIVQWTSENHLDQTNWSKYILFKDGHQNISQTSSFLWMKRLKDRQHYPITKCYFRKYRFLPFLPQSCKQRAVNLASLSLRSDLDLGHRCLFAKHPPNQNPTHYPIHQFTHLRKILPIIPYIHSPT